VVKAAETVVVNVIFLENDRQKILEIGGLTWFFLARLCALLYTVTLAIASPSLPPSIGEMRGKWLFLCDRQGGCQLPSRALSKPLERMT
jgi:hypothetical protein